MYKNVMNFHSRFRLVFLSMALVVLLVSCNNDDDDVSQPIEVAYVSVYHASPDAPAFDIVVDGRVINTWPFDYASYSGYLNFFTGNRNIRFHSTHDHQALIDTTFNFGQGKAYSLFAIHTGSGNEALLVVDSAAAPAAGRAMVRFVHLSPDAPAYDIFIKDQPNSALFEDKAFKQATAFKEIGTGEQAFEITDAAGAEVVLTTDRLDILPGRYYTILVRGFAAAPEGNTHSLSVEVVG